MNDAIRETVVRRVRLTEKHRPFEIDVGRLVQPDWLAITHATGKNIDSFNLVFFGGDGNPIDWVQYDSVEIALDQAHAMIGVERSEWESCKAEIANNDGRIRWEEIQNGP